MASPRDPSRRAVVAALAGLPLINLAARTKNDGNPQQAGSRTLVAYFSRSGNTRVVAGLVHRALGTDLFDIRPARPYPEDYLETVEQARWERDTDYEPALEAKIPNMAAYDTVYVGFPIWGETAPPVIRAFLSAHDLCGKTLVPLVTHGGYGLGNSLSILASYAPKARLHPGFLMQADQERQTMERVVGWLKQQTE
ncbi:MAG TPA: flavodoxin [Dyella sp.]|uniref:flavodoxin n=1 Tax=Dyella sp. TaxID=1869338 RepID=UPI002CCD7EE2|nr:flavodoxin [Dyella sp.]HTV83920.1 flavodoxin [Dyella sp.]